MTFISTELQQLLQLASDANSLMSEQKEVNSRVLELYDGSPFLRALKYQDIIGQEKRVLMDLWEKYKQLRTLKNRLFLGELASEGREGELAGYLEVFIAALQHAVETLLKILVAARLHAEQYSEATDAYLAAGFYAAPVS